MSPYEHGEVYVLDDGGETDLDLGNYERMMYLSLSRSNNLTTGKIYDSVIKKERRGEYLGKTVQVVPHITGAILEWINSTAQIPTDGSGCPPQICMIELGGTIGDIESMPFVEALRQLQLKVGRSQFCLVHVSMVPTVGPPPAEQKTKPTQHSVKELRSLGLTPDFIVCRSKDEVKLPTREKIGLFCNVPPERVLSLYDVPSIYRVPMEMLERNLDILISEQLGLTSYRSVDPALQTSFPTVESDLGSLRLQRDVEFAKAWKAMATSMESPSKEVTVALVGKYQSQSDSYLSVQSSLSHACGASQRTLRLEMIDSELLEGGDGPSWERVKRAHGVLVPGGFGDRGTRGKIDAIEYAREAGVPFLGICLGMQLAVIEFARNVLGVEHATSSEFDDSVVGTEDEVVLFMPEGSTDQMGGTMRLGSRTSYLREGSLASRIYGASVIHERHRHRYEVNPSLVPRLEEAGLAFSGKDDSGLRAEVIELDARFEHPFYFGLQGHPEYKSRPLAPSPPFLAFIRAAAGIAEQKDSETGEGQSVGGSRGADQTEAPQEASEVEDAAGCGQLKSSEVE